MLGAPIVHSLRGKQFIEHGNPFDVAMTGLLGHCRCRLAQCTGAQFLRRRP